MLFRSIHRVDVVVRIGIQNVANKTEVRVSFLEQVPVAEVIDIVGWPSVEGVLSDIASESAAKSIAIEVVVCCVAIVFGNQVAVDPQVVAIIKEEAIEKSDSGTSAVVCDRISSHSQAATVVQIGSINTSGATVTVDAIFFK